MEYYDYDICACACARESNQHMGVVIMNISHFTFSAYQKNRKQPFQKHFLYLLSLFFLFLLFHIHFFVFSSFTKVNYIYAVKMLLPYVCCVCAVLKLLTVWSCLFGSIHVTCRKMRSIIFAHKLHTLCLMLHVSIAQCTVYWMMMYVKIYDKIAMMFKRRIYRRKSISVSTFIRQCESEILKQKKKTV